MRERNNKRFKRSRKGLPVFEALEDRQLYSVVSVTPGNFMAAINASNVGDKINFAPGTYTLQTNPSGAAATWPAGRIYEGNGATLALSGGLDTRGTEGLVQVYGTSSVTEITGFTFTDAPLECQGGVFNVHGNTFTNSRQGIYVAGENNSEYTGNTITNMSNEGIYGYPGSNDVYSNNTITNTGNDGIHLAAASGNNNTVSGNVVTGCRRIPIEIQLTGSNIAIVDNYAELTQPAFGSYMAYSIACGNANGVNVSDNIGVSNKANTGACVEIMGYNATVSDNTSWGFAQAILNGAQGSNLHASGNVVYGGSLMSSDAVPWPIAPIAGSNTVLPLSAAAAPSPSNSSAPAPVITAPAPVQVIPAGITATANGQSGQITVTAPAGSTLGIYASSLDPSTAVNLGTVSGTSATISGIPSSWQVTVTVTTGGTTYTLPAVQVTNSSIASNGSFNPALVTAVTAPVVTAPVLSAPVVTAPVVSAPVVTAPVVTTPVVTAPVVSAPVVSAPVVSAPVVASVTAAPTNFAATSPSSTEVVLSWTDHTSGTGTYVVERRATRSGLGFQTIATLPAGTTSYADASVTANWEYSYQLVASVNGVSSSVASVHMQVRSAPVASAPAAAPVSTGIERPTSTPVARGTAAPTDFVAASFSHSEINLSWTDNTDGVATYVLQRNAGGSSFKTVATLGAGATSYSDMHVAPNTEYHYRLVAVISRVASAPAQTQGQAAKRVAQTQGQLVKPVAQAKAPRVTTSAGPTVLLASSANFNSIKLSWDDTTSGSATYLIGRRTTYGSSKFQIIAKLPAGTTTFTDKHVEANFEYDYSLQAVSPAGVTSAAATVRIRAEVPAIQWLLAA